MPRIRKTDGSIWFYLFVGIFAVPILIVYALWKPIWRTLDFKDYLSEVWKDGGFRKLHKLKKYERLS